MCTKILSFLAALLWAGVACAQTEFSPDTGINFGSWHKSFQGAPAGPTCLVPSKVTSLTPDPTRCHVYGIQLGTSLTINNPRPGTLLPGEPQVFELQQPGTGSAVTPSVGTSYHLPGGVTSLSGLLSTANSLRDLWSCQGSVLDTPPQLECQNPSQNIGPTSGFQLVAHTSCAAASGCTTSGVNTSGANLVVAVGTGCATTAPTISDSSSNSYSAAGSFQGAGPGVEIFYVSSPTTSASQTFSINACNGSSSFATLEITAWSGALSSSPLDQTNGGSTSSSVTTFQPGSITPSVSNALIIAGATTGQTASGSASSINSGFTISDQNGFSNAVNYAGMMAYLVQSSAAAVNPTWTFPGSGPAAAAIASFKP